MAVKYDEQQKIFHIFSKNTSYVTGIVREKYLTHLYWGKTYPGISREPFHCMEGPGLCSKSR